MTSFGLHTINHPLQVIEADSRYIAREDQEDIEIAEEIVFLGREGIADIAHMPDADAVHVPTVHGAFIRLVLGMVIHFRRLDRLEGQAPLQVISPPLRATSSKLIRWGSPPMRSERS